MTDLQKLYTTKRLTDNLKHRAAIRAVSRETGIDEGSVARALARADREQKRARKGPKRAAA